MSRYSSDSNSSRGDDHYRKKRNLNRTGGRSRSGSYSSTDSSYTKQYSRKHKRGKHHHSHTREHHGKTRSVHERSHSKNRSHGRRSREKSRSFSRERSHDRTMSRSKKKVKKHSRSQSPSKSRYRYRSYSRSQSKEKSKSRSRSRSVQRSHSQSSRDSQLYSKLKSEKQEQKESNDVCDPQKENGKNSKEQTIENIDKILGASGLLSLGPAQNVLDKLNNPVFEQKPFSSTKASGRIQDKVLDIEVDLPAQPLPTNDDDPKSIFHSRLFSDQQRMEKWIKKLYHLRQKAVNGEPII